MAAGRGPARATTSRRTRDEDEKAFAARFRLVHEWRKFLFDDPGLPAALLPADWPGVPAAELFTERGGAPEAGAPTGS